VARLAAAGVELSNLSDKARLAMGYIVAPYVHACCPASCTCRGRLARYIPEAVGVAFALETFVAARPYSRRELRHQGAWTRRMRAACAAAPWID